MALPVTPRLERPMPRLKSAPRNTSGRLAADRLPRNPLPHATADALGRVADHPAALHPTTRFMVPERGF